MLSLMMGESASGSFSPRRWKNSAISLARSKSRVVVSSGELVSSKGMSCPSARAMRLESLIHCACRALDISLDTTVRILERRSGSLSFRKAPKYFRSRLDRVCGRNSDGPDRLEPIAVRVAFIECRSEEHTSELQ